MSKLREVVTKGFRGRRVVILGDLVADQFLMGTIARVSREAPVFILDHEKTETHAGGAGNAAVNVATLGGTPRIVGFVGSDPNGRLLRQRMADAGVDCEFLVSDDRVMTTTKVRVLAGQHYAPRQQVIRIDYADSQTINDELRARLRDNLHQACDGADALIISDYSYGAADRETAALAQQIAVDRGIPLLIDSRFALADFSDATAATPNQDEVEHILGKNFSLADCEGLRKRLGLKALLVTRGNKGMTLFEEDKPHRHFDAVGSKEPIDVTGAGDTVIGAFALGLASGLSFADAASVANHAGGIVVMKRGTASASLDELIESLDAHPEVLDHSATT